ncbi:MAG: fructose-6-phosphate aldolase [Acidobacteria bacterium]|nr:fructose-6-phosphate aldolase [Acidobacteriota bacterium]
MKFFLDTANLQDIRTGVEMGIVDGVTTNPTYIAREGRPMEEQIRAICDLVDGDISAEVVATIAPEMISEGRALARIHPNVVVKIPLIREGIKAVKALSSEGIRVNVTLCFTPTQALLAAKAGAYIISPFVGRLEDIGSNGMDVVRDIVKLYNLHGYPTKVLAASMRGPMHIFDAAMAGAHIATMPLKVLDMLFNHPLTDKGLAMFLADYQKAFQEATVG